MTRISRGVVSTAAAAGCAALLAAVVLSLTGCPEHLVQAVQPTSPPPAAPKPPPVPRQPAAPPLPTDKWELRVYGMKTAFLQASPDKAPRADRLARAVKELLQDGQAQARTGVGHVLDSTPAEKPEHFFAAFALAYADLDYQRGRDVLLRYQRSWGHARRGPPSADWLSFSGSDPEDVFHIDYEDTPQVLHALYDRRKDPVILRGLMEASPWADGAGKMALDAALEQVLRQDAHAYLRELSGLDPKVQKSVCAGLGADVDEKTAQRSRSALEAEATRKGSPYRALARQALKWMEEERKKWGGQSKGQ